MHIHTHTHILDRLWLVNYALNAGSKHFLLQIQGENVANALTK